VIGIFKEVGAPARLNTLVEGESLLNDAAAIALYAALMGVLSHTTELSLGGLSQNFLYLFIGGGLTGFVLARLACLSFPLLRGWPAAEISLTISVAYLSYFISEHYLHVSGVVATVVAGLVVGSTGRTRMAPTTFVTLSQSWHQFGFWANSLVFLFAAMLIPKVMENATWIHLLYVFLVFAATLLARAIVVFGLVPILSFSGIGARIGTRFRVVLWWGGLRGALSLALALAVTERTSLPAEAREFIAITVTGFVLATLFINGLSLQPMIKMLGLNLLTKKERALRNQAVIVATAMIQQETDEIARSEQVSSVARDRVYTAFNKSIDEGSELHVEHFSLKERIDLGLTILARHEYERYFDVLKHQIIDRNMAERLLGRAERLEESVRLRGTRGFESSTARSMRYPRRFRHAMRVYEIFGAQRWLAHELSQRFVALMCMRSISQQLLDFIAQKLPEILGAEACEKISALHAQRLSMIREALHALELQYPSYSLWMQEHYLGRIARRLERERYGEMFDQSLISGEVYESLSDQVTRRWAFLDKDAPLDIEMGSAELVARVPLLTGLPAEAQRAVTRMLKPRLFLPNQLIWGKKAPPFGLYIVASGAVTILLPDGTHVELGTGEFFGEMYLLDHDVPEDFEVRSLGYSRVLCLPAKDFDELLKQDPAIKVAIELVARQRMRALEVWRSQQSNPESVAKDPQ
jgi:CPA1 family monovalent cation:H+ antiporter